MGYCAQNNHNFNIEIILFRTTALIKAIWQHTYFISLLFTSLKWRGFESRNQTIGGFVSSSRSLLDFERDMYHKYACTFINERK